MFFEEDCCIIQRTRNCFSSANKEFPEIQKINGKYIHSGFRNEKIYIIVSLL
jgi:hypothetical protein